MPVMVPVMTTSGEYAATQSGNNSDAQQLGDQSAFRALAETVKDPVVICSAWRDGTGEIVDFVYEFVNEAAVYTIGIPSAQLLGQRLLEVLPVHRELGLFDRYRNVALTGHPDVIEIPWFEDGNVAGAFEVSVSVMGDGIISVARNITERLEAEAELAHAAAIQQLLAENASELLIRLTSDGNIAVSSKPVGSALAASHMIGVHLADLAHLDDRGFVLDTLKSARLTGSTMHTDLRMASAAPGELPWVSLSARCVVDATGNTEFHVSIRDIQARRAAEQALVAAVRAQQVTLDSLSAGVVLQSEEEGVVLANRAVREVLGLVGASDAALEQIGAFASLHEPDGSPLDFDDTPVKRVFRSGQAELGRLLQLRLPDGSHRWIQVNAVLIDDKSDGEKGPPPVRVLSTFIDFTERIVAGHRVTQDSELLRATFDSVHAGLMAVDSEGTIIQVNQRFRDMTRGHHQVGETLLAATYDYLICDELGVPLEVDERPIVRGLAGEHVSDLASLLQWPDGVEISILASASPIYDDDDIVGAVLTIQDVTALRLAEAELRELATIDSLTGLPNRRAVIAYLDEAIERSATALDRPAELPSRRSHDAIERRAAASDQLTVLFLDLDGFKSINDTMGHEAGDELLCAVAQRLTATTRSNDLVGRMGGDEFVAVLEQLSPQDVAELTARIETEISQPFLLAAGIATISVSIGQAVHDASHTTDSILAAADVEMYRTKHAGFSGQTD